MAQQQPTQPYVLIIGAAGIDSKGRANVPLTLGTSTPGKVRISVGGTARNVADNLARLGVETLLLSADFPNTCLTALRYCQSFPIYYRALKVCVDK